MKWKSPSDRAVMWAMSPVLFPIALVVVPVIGVMIGLEKLRAMLCPFKPWHVWYAWRPVHAWNKPDEIGRTWVWLEPVTRTGSCAYGWDYRLIAPDQEGAE